MASGISILAAVATAACCAAPGAFAQDAPRTKLYVAADVGTSQIGVSTYAYASAVAPRDEVSPVFRVRGGVQLVRFFALEVGYADLGNYKAGVRIDCTIAPQSPCVPDFTSEVDMRAWTFNVAAVLPIGDRLSLRANKGWSLRTKKTHQVPVTGADYRLKSEKVLPFFGFGAAFALTPKLELVAEWNKFVGRNPSLAAAPPSEGSLLDEADSEAFSMGARFRF